MPVRPEDWPRVRELFEAIVALSPEARQQHLASACGEDSALREQVEQLLASHDRASGFLETPAGGVPFDTTATHEDLAGRHIGPYALIAHVGAGGMGDVYKARDTRLDRTVAIKMLSADIARDVHARQRFEREARAVAALNHPHICTLHDIGHHEGIDFLVMEYVEGETLSVRLARGPLPIVRALEYAVEIARALDKAHRAGIIHRDLKPGNIMLTKAGTKLLDFGLAKSYTPAVAGATSQLRRSDDLTVTGTIVGTTQYMAPEQVEGKDTDARSDIFAFGAVLYEMIAGRKAFQGQNPASIIAAILERDPPPLPALQPLVPPAIDRAVRKCLTKDPDARWQSAADLASELEWIARADDRVNATAPAKADALQAGRSVRKRTAWTIAAVSVVALAVVIVALAWRRSSPIAAPAAKRFVITPTDIEPALGRIALVPDGSGLAYVGARERDTRIYLHTLGDGASSAFAETAQANASFADYRRNRDPFVSPDGKWLGFVHGYQLKKVPLRGGPAVVICDSPQNFGSSWGSDDRIVFSSRYSLWQVDAAGGSPRSLTKLDEAAGETAHVWPHMLPGATAVVYTILGKSRTMEEAQIAVLSLRTGERRILIKGGASARYTPTGHLVYLRGSDLLAVPFDLDRLTVSGSPTLVVPGVWFERQSLGGWFDIAADGTLAYVAGGTADFLRSLVWVDRSGSVRPLPLPPRPYLYPTLLPDGQQVIVEIEEQPHSIWHADLRSGALTRLTHETPSHRPTVSKDGRVMAFSSDRVVPRSLFLQATDGSGTAARLTQAAYAHNATSISPDGRWLAFTESHGETKTDIWVLPLQGDHRPVAFLNTRFSEHSAAFSPDGRWIAYVSDESGREEVLISAFPGPGPRKEISTSGGEMPLFSHDGRTLFYRSGNHVMAADIVTQPTLTSSAPRVAFDMPWGVAAAGLPNFAITKTGDALLAVKDADREPGPPKVHVVVNWFEELRRLTAAK